MGTPSPKILKRTRRHARIRAKVQGTPERPRLAVFRSNRFIYAQLIDDVSAKTLAASDSRAVKGASSRERAEAVGKTIAEEAKKKGVEKAVFDRGGFQFQGVIAALAEGARKGGLDF
jgi:large subunit ribosomal protein L18